MDERMEVADILLRYEKLDMALEVLEELREEFPNEKDIYYKLAKVYEKKGFFDKSLEMLNNVRIMYPKDGQVYFKIAVIYQMKDQLDKCFEFLSLAIKNGFASEEVMYYKGLAYEAEDDLNKAIYNYNKSLSSNKNYLPSKYRKYAIFMRMNRVDDAKAVIEDMIKYNADEYDGYGLKFMLNAKEKNMEEALKTLETAKAVFNDYSPLKLDYVKYHIVKEQYDEALEIISSINEEDAYYEDFIICKAKILSFKGKDAEVIELLNDDLVYNEENSELIFMLALLNYKTSRLENAFNNLDILCNMEDLNNDYCKMAVILKAYALREKGQEQEAIEQFKEAYKILKIQNLSNPYDINTLLYRCITLIEAKEYKKCHEILNGIDRLGEENYLKKADEIRKLMAIKKDEKKDHIILEKEIITGILDKR